MVKNDKRKHVTCAGCIVYRSVGEGLEILLIKPMRDLDAWGIPKGHKEVEESLVDCALRETWEETGLICRPDSSFDNPLGPVLTINPREYKKVYAYLALPMGSHKPDPIMKSEVDDIRWWSIDALPKLHRYQIPLITDAVSQLRAAMEGHVIVKSFED